jgi:hypothetical protein
MSFAAYGTIHLDAVFVAARGYIHAVFAAVVTGTIKMNGFCAGKLKYIQFIN